MKNFLIWCWQEDDQWVSVCPKPLISSCGDTKAEAQQNLKDALELYFEGEPAPALSSFDSIESDTISIAL